MAVSLCFLLVPFCGARLLPSTSSLLLGFWPFLLRLFSEWPADVDSPCPSVAQSSCHSLLVAI